MPLVRSLAFPHGPLSAPLSSLLQDYRLLVNRCLREVLTRSLTALGSLDPLGRSIARELGLNGAHGRTAAQVALSLARGHRRRVRHGRSNQLPYVRRPFIRADDRTFHFDPNSGKLRLSLRNGVWDSLTVPVCAHHRAVLAESILKQLILTPDRLVLVVERPAPQRYRSERLLALDTNEASLDGVQVGPEGTSPTQLPFPEVPTIQHRHFVRRRRLARKKAHDRRVARRLLGREGRRERYRVLQRLHLLSKRLVEGARESRALLALEDLALGRPPRHGSPRFRRRLSAWPRRELHRQILYKAEERGVPIVWVNPRFTRRTCPRCGDVAERRSRVGPMFDCARCGWRLDRQLNAGANIARTVLGEISELGGLRLDLDALTKDARKPLYAGTTVPGHGRSGRSGRIDRPRRERPSRSI